MNQLLSGALVLVLTIFSGVMDARAFVYAARAWPGGRIDMRLAGASLFYFFLGVSLYIVAVRFMKSVGVNAVALQSAIWFVATAIGIAVLDGSVMQWSRMQKLVAFVIAAGLTWLIASSQPQGS